MKIEKLTLAALAAAVFLAFGSSTAFAISVTDGFITVSDTGGGTGTNVLYNPGETGFSIGASINTGPGYTATFTSTEQISSAGGQASLVAVDGGLRDLCFSLTNGATFTTLVLNPDLLNNSTGTMSFQVTYIMPAGVFNTVAFTLNANGQNFFEITASNGARMTQVCWTSTGDIVDANQYRIDGIEPAQTTVPEGGATLMLLGASLGAISIGRRILLKR